MPPINVTRSYLPDYEEFIHEIKDIWDTHWLTNMGSKHAAFESKLIDYLHVPYVNLFTNGHLALEALLSAMDLSGEVITTPFTFASTTHAIVRNGLTPVFCDIDPETYNLDASRLEDLITERTTAILPVHVYGTVCDVQSIESIAVKHNLKVVYDAAHAFGVTLNGESIASFGHASMFSFHATKVFNSIEGGAIACKDPSLTKRLNYLKNFGITGPEKIEAIGGNAKMNEFQASMGLCNLRHLDAEITKRRRIVERYNERLEGINGIKLSKPQKGVNRNYSYYPVLFDHFNKFNRNEVADVLSHHQIYTRKYFYPLTNSYECYKDRFPIQETPIAQYIADRILTLPLYSDLAIEDVDTICDIIIGMK